MADEQIGVYTVVKRLAATEGAQGRIYHARRGGSDFILKAPEHAEHREEEIRAWKQATQKHHPNVLSLIETFTHEGQVYLVSQFVEQGTLKDWLAGQTGHKAPTQEEALSIFRGIVAGLAHVHAADLTHRDLKPANILLSHGHPMLMDFGLARLTPKTVATMGVGGTLEYAPPEIAIELLKLNRRESSSILKQETPVSKRGDVWSAGIIFYELLFGNTPFEDVLQIRDLTVPVPKLETLPPPLGAFLKTALAKDASQRFPDAPAMKSAFVAMETTLRAWEMEQKLVDERERVQEAQARAEAEKKRAEAAEQAKMQAERARHRAEARTKSPTLGRRSLIGTGLASLFGGAVYLGTRLADLKGSGVNPVFTPLTVAEAIKLPPTHPAPLTLAEYKAQMVQIPGGTFQMGSNNGNSDQKPVHSVTLSPFAMGRTPVTVALWQEFCKTTGRTMPVLPDYPIWKGGWASVLDHPMVNVTWEDCKAYADWSGLKLPTEAQWEYAARGGLKGKYYPWGDAMDYTKLWCSKKYYGDSAGTAPVSRSNNVFVNGYGLLDMSGNVWQWCSDSYDGYGRGAVTDPVGASPGTERGGSWYNDDAGNFRCANRNGDAPGGRYYGDGFRLSSPGP